MSNSLDPGQAGHLALSNCDNGFIGMCYCNRFSFKRAKRKKAQNPKERRVKEKRSRLKENVPLKILQRYGKMFFMREI